MFVLKHISKKSNKIEDALSRRQLYLQESQIKVLGFEFMKELYNTNVDFREPYAACKNPTIQD